MLNSENIFDELKYRFPDFEIYKEAEGLHTVVFALFVQYLSSAFKSSNPVTINKFSQFINEMCVSNDNSIEACIDEIVLGLYTEPNRPYEAVKKSLDNKAQIRFDKTTALWDKQKLIE